MSSDPHSNGKGYGSGSYGSDPYGHLDTKRPEMVSVVSDGRSLHVTFSEPIQWDFERLESTNWEITSTFGVVPDIQLVYTPTYMWDELSDTVTLVHSGTTLGGLYTLTCHHCVDAAGNHVSLTGKSRSFLARAWYPEATVTPHEGNRLHVSTNTPFLQGADDLTNYVLATEYPISPSLLSIVPDSTGAMLYCKGLTSTEYELTLGPAQAILSTEPTTKGWHGFVDNSGKLTATSAYKMDASVSDLPASWYVSVGDGETVLTVLFDEGGVVQVFGGAINATFEYDWSSLDNLTLLRNPLTGHVALLLDGVPVLSRALTDVTEVHGEAWNVLVAATAGDATLTVDSVSLTASDTMYLEDGNFVHELKAQFLALDDVAKSRIQVSRGPLTKGWGDATPAGINDVAVRINDILVPVSDVNPYLGLIYLETPVPKMPVGEITVDVDYAWFENPQMSFQSLNHPGLVLNKWDQARNPEVQSATLAKDTLGGGSVEGERYPISLTLMRPPRVRPKWISHRHVGFDNTYTASLNTPVSLVLNANIYGNRARKSYSQYALSGQFEGTLGDGWEARGNAYLTEDSDGYTSLKSEGSAAVAKAIEMNPVGATVTLVGRVEADTPTVVNDRLALGPAIAFHDTKDLRLLAAVDIDGVSHIAMLVGDEIDNADSWEPVYTVTADFLSEGRLEVLEDDLPELFSVGLRVVIPRGSQSGQYTVTQIDKLSTGNWWLHVTPDFPEDTTIWGGGRGEVHFETPWKDSPFNLHLVGRADNESIGVAFTGQTSFLTSVELPSVDAHVLYRHGELPLDLAEDGRGEVLFGNLVSEGQSRWDFVRYITVPDEYITSSIGHLDALTLHEIPTEQSVWRKTSAQGVVGLLPDDRLEFGAEGAGDHRSGFEKMDALIPASAGLEVSSKFKVESPTTWGDAGFRVQGPNHDVLCSTIPYTDDGMFIASSTALVGTRSFDTQGWQLQGIHKYRFEGLRLNLVKTIDHPLSISSELPNEGLTASRSMDARLVFHSATYNDLDDAGLVLGMDAGSKSVALLFANGKLGLTSDGLNYLAEAAFEWLDGEQHHYNITVDVEAVVPEVVLSVDGVELCSAELALFANSGENIRAYLIGFGAPEWDMDLYSFRVREVASGDVKRTLGIWKGGDADDLDSWELARTLEGEIVEMDWSEEITAMVVVDPNWGASLFRPDLPPPDGYVGEGRPERHDPTGAWATVEWEHLPVSRRDIATLHFGMENADSQATSVWDHFRYRVYIQENEKEVPPRTAVLNRWNVLSSGEYTGDITVETVRVKVRGGLINVHDANISAKRVFHVAVDGVLLGNGSWSFDEKGQTIKLAEAGTKFSTAEVTFSPGPPITKTYLLTQPLKDGITNLNEGTPPYLLTQLGKLQRSIASDPPREGEIIDLISEDPGFASQDPTSLVEYSHDSAYSSVEFFQVENGQETGLISTPDDGLAPAKGLAEINLEGRMFGETLAPPPAHPFEQGGGAPGSFLMLGGGAHPLTGTLGGGSVQGAVTWPSAPSRPDGKPSLVANRTFWDLRERHEDAVAPPITAALTYLMEEGGAYSRTGPWGGVESLSPLSLLNGGGPADGLVLYGGAPLPEPTTLTRRYFDENEGVWKA